MALFSSDAPDSTTAEPLVCADEAMQSGSQSHELRDPFVVDEAMCLPTEPSIRVAASGGFEVFEETNLDDALDTGCNLILPGTSGSLGNDGGQPELRRRS